MISNKKFFVISCFIIFLAAISNSAKSDVILYHEDNTPSQETTFAVSADQVDPDFRDVVHDAASGAYARSSSGACVRTKWLNNFDKCAETAVVATHQPARTLSREERTIFFGFNETSISPEMRKRLDDLAANLSSNKQVKGAHIVGYADRIGNSDYNKKLSEKRAENTKQYLIAKGIINTDVAETRWYGSSESTTSCSDNLHRKELIECLQKDRRVEVELDYLPDQRVSQ